jgi:hypothetical protein
MSNLKTNLTTLQEIAKERTVKTQSIEYDLETLVKKISKGIIKLDPDYQRRHRWNLETSSKLIESLILNIPIPTIYLSQDVDVDTDTEESRYSVIDGQQRLTAISHFFNNKFQLIGLKTLDSLNDCYYKDLPPFLIRRLEERTIKCLRIDSTIDSQVKIDIFERLNSGSVKLEAQELRNAVYSGPFNELCKKLSKDINFKALLQIRDEQNEKEGEKEQDNKVKKMQDVELVLRFFAMINGNYLNFKKTKEKGFGDFLSDVMEKNNKLNAEELKALESEFTETMKTIRRDFGDIAFAKYKFENQKIELQSKFNFSVFDALATSCHDLIYNNGVTSFANKKQAFNDLFKEDEFYDSNTGSYLDTLKIKYRIEKATATLQ